MIAMDGPSAATDGVGFPAFPAPGIVSINGITLPFVNQTTPPSGVTPGTFNRRRFYGGPRGQPRRSARRRADCRYRWPAGRPHRSASDAASSTTRSPRPIRRARKSACRSASRAKMVIAVSDLDGTLIGLYRMTDGTVFSIDVAATQSPQCDLFQRDDAAARGSESGADGNRRHESHHRIWRAAFLSLRESTALRRARSSICTRRTRRILARRDFRSRARRGPKVNQSGIVFFPGSEPLYINGVLVGGLGVSGDGVDQDDYVTAGGAAGFEAARIDSRGPDRD